MRNITKRIIVCAITGILNLALIAQAYSEHVNARPQLQTGILPILEYKILKKPDNLKITTADLKKGYKDVKAGTKLYISTNNPHGYILSVHNKTGDNLTSIRVKDGSNYLKMSPASTVEIHVPPSKLKYDIKELSYRFYLSPNAVPGVYRWPMVVWVYLL